MCYYIFSLQKLKKIYILKKEKIFSSSKVVIICLHWATPFYVIFWLTSSSYIKWVSDIFFFDIPLRALIKIHLLSKWELRLDALVQLCFYYHFIDASDGDMLVSVDIISAVYLCTGIKIQILCYQNVLSKNV